MKSEDTTQSMPWIIRMRNNSDIEEALKRLEPGECALLLSKNLAEFRINGNIDVEIVRLRRHRDKAEVDCLLAKGKKVLCISNDGFRHLSEFALSRLKFIILADSNPEQERLVELLLRLVRPRHA